MANGNGGVTWKVVACSLATVVLLLGGAVAGNLNSRQTDIEKQVNEQAADIAVIKEQVQQTRRDVEKIEKTTQDTNKKLDELKDLLRRQR